MRSFVVGLLISLAACSDDTPVQSRLGSCDISWNSAFNGQHPQYCELACHKFVTATSAACDAKTFRNGDASCASTFMWDGTGQISQPLAQPLTGCCIKGGDTTDDPAEQFAECN